MFTNLFSSGKKEDRFTLRSFIENYTDIDKYTGIDKDMKKNILKYLDDKNQNVIEEINLISEKLKDQGITHSPLDGDAVLTNLLKELKNYNYVFTYKDIKKVINYYLSNKYRETDFAKSFFMFTKGNLIDDNFIEHLATVILEYTLSLDRVVVYSLRLLKSLNAGDDYIDKFMSKISPELFKDKSKTFYTVLHLKDLGVDSDDIKMWRMKNIIPDYYNMLILSMKTRLTNNIIYTPRNKDFDLKMDFFKSISLLDEAQVKPFIKEIIDIFQPKSNEEIISIFWKIGEGFKGERNEEILKVSDYLFPSLVNIYSITYADIMSYINNNTISKSKVLNKLFFSVLSSGIIPSKEELENITKYYEGFLKDGLAKNLFKYDPELYTLSVKLNQEGNIDHNDENYKKWVQDWYIPHSKLKDDDFFTFSEQEQACYLNEPEKFKVENTSLGTVSVNVLKYNIKHIDGKEFAYIYKYKDKQGNSPEIQDIITRRKETIDIDLKFTNSEIIDYHSELRVLEAYKRYMEKQALFISSLSLDEYGIVFSHFTGMFQYSTNYIKNRGNVDTSLPIYSCLYELIIGVCLENGIDVSINDLSQDMTLEELFYTKLSGKKDSLDKTEIKDLALNVSKKFMERYYIEFNKIFEKAPETEDDLVIYRGVRDVYWNNNISKGEFSALNIQSTTLIPHIPGSPYDIIQNYTDASTEKDTVSCCLKRILLKKGCRSIYIQLMEAAKRPLSQVILPSYSKYIVKEVHDKLMIEELNNNQSCNVQKDFIKTFDMELIQTPSYPSVEDVVSKFSSHFKSWMYDINSHWIVKGGFGLKKVLEIRYNKKDAIKTDDIDISVLFTKNNEDEIKAYKDKLIKEFNDFAYSTGVPYLFSYIEPRYIGEKELKWICQFSYAGREWIDISLVYSTWGKVEVDELVSEKVGLPVKTIVGYAKDYKEILREENIQGIDDRTYKKRNPKTGFLAMKGRKDIQRTKELCFIDEVEKEFPTLCSFLKLSSVRVFMNLPEKELKALLK
jgi:hypothetical protein